jgi:hypothetical protein
MKKRIFGLVLCMMLVTVILSGCGMRNEHGASGIVVVENGETVTETVQESEEEELQTEPEPEEPDPASLRTPTKVKGIYISAYVAGTSSMVDDLIEKIDQTEINTIIIDIKDDYGRVACEMDSELIDEIGSEKIYIPNVQELTAKLHEHGIYTIARIPAFRDAWLGDARPDWCVQLADGNVFRDRDGNAWVNPYKQEAWDYLVEIASQAKQLGFDEVQFDYIRFCTEKGMSEAVFSEEDTKGRSRTDIIVEFVDYIYDKLASEGLFVSADVFGAIMGSGVDADAVGQIYGEMAKHLDYISPMIYPSHYADGNYGIEHPDLQPYETIRAALADSRKELYFAGLESDHVAQVRPWLQDFTASWLQNHLSYGPEEIRQQIQAVYDAGYDEWMLWDASCKYSWDGLLTPEEAEAETARIAESRADLPETTWSRETEPETSEEESGEESAAEESAADESEAGAEAESAPEETASTQ